MTRLVSCFLLVLAMTYSSFALGQQQQLNIRQFMTGQEFKAAGLEKLTAAEFQALEKWFNRHTTNIYRLAKGETGTSGSGRGYVVQQAINDETFVINGNIYKAKTYCMNLDRAGTA